MNDVCAEATKYFASAVGFLAYLPILRSDKEEYVSKQSKVAEFANFRRCSLFPVLLLTVAYGLWSVYSCCVTPSS